MRAILVICLLIPLSSQGAMISSEYWFSPTLTNVDRFLATANWTGSKIVIDEWRSDNVFSGKIQWVANEKSFGSSPMTGIKIGNRIVFHERINDLIFPGIIRGDGSIIGLIDSLRSKSDISGFYGATPIPLEGAFLFMFSSIGTLIIGRWINAKKEV